MALQFPSDNTRWVGYIRFQPLDHDDNEVGQIIELPLPPTLNLSDGITYENVDLGMAGQAAEALANSELQDLAKKYGARYTDADGNVDFAQMGSDIVAKIGVSGARLANGKVPNPDTRTMFKQPNLRSVAFTFKLIPTTSKEPKTIREIVKEFRTHMYPEKDGEGPNIFYRFPHKFQIEMFLGADAKTKIPPDFKPMYLTQCTVSYGGGVLAKQNSDHWFAETDIQLNFTEAVTLVSGDVKDGY